LATSTSKFHLQKLVYHQLLKANTTPMNSKINLLGFTAIVGLSILTFSCQKPTPPPPPGPVPVNLIEVTEQQATYFDVYPGNTIARNEVELRSEVSGFITGFYFQEGQPVKKGQKLYEIEQSKYSASLSQAEANLQIAKANLEKAQNDAERYNRLSQQGMTTQQRLEYSQTDLKTANAQVLVAEAQVKSAATDFRHSIITAPFDGTIGFSLVKLGAFITAGQTQLNTISSDDPIAVDFVIGEKEINRFIQLKDKRVSKLDSTFTIILPDNSRYPFSGRIELLDRAVDPQTGTLKVRLTFPNPKRILKTGLSVKVRVININEDKLPVVPYKAVTEQMGEFFVYVIEKDTARQHKVRLGPAIKENIVIFEGLTPGEKVVVDGVQKLRDGAAVMIAPPPTATTTGK
jgi:membrane fusion protein (multidrug efflux system)